MILPDFILSTRQNKKFSTTGIDSRDKCQDPAYFDSYPYSISYQYNSRGYRDKEWPDTVEELKKCIWCFGDSFTVGLGNPLEHIWPVILENRTGIRCVNISLDGASNDWIARKVNRVIENINPNAIVIQWSFLNRVESSDTSLSDEYRRMHCDPRDWDYDETEAYSKRFNDILTTIHHDNLVHSAIPKYRMFDKQLEFVKPIYEVERIDLARDGFHYGVLSANAFVDYVISSMKTI
jgi:hypothetical protein